MKILKGLLFSLLSIICFFAIIAICAVSYFKHAQTKMYLNVIPKEFEITEMTYRNDALYGLGPGGNETGLITYDLPKDIQKAIVSQGTEYLNNLPSSTKKHNEGWRGHYSKWKETPITVSRHWTDYMGLPNMEDYSDQKGSLAHYLDRYGFGISVPPKIIEEADNALFKKGSFYIHTPGGGILIIIPSSKKIIYAYSG